MNIGLAKPSSSPCAETKAQSSPMKPTPGRRISLAIVLVLPTPPAAGSAIPWPLMLTVAAWIIATSRSTRIRSSSGRTVVSSSPGPFSRMRGPSLMICSRGVRIREVVLGVGDPMDRLHVPGDLEVERPVAVFGQEVGEYRAQLGGRRRTPGHAQPGSPVQVETQPPAVPRSVRCHGATIRGGAAEVVRPYVREGLRRS